MSTEDAVKTILLVGHCRPDEFMLRAAIDSVLPRVQTRAANDDASLARLAQGADLLLVNRVLDGGFTSTDGQSVIERWGRGGRPRVMLVSNLDDAQRRAGEAGALPGFGKTELRSAKMRDALLAALPG